MGKRHAGNGKWMAKCKRFEAKLRRRDKELAKKGIYREVDSWLAEDGTPMIKLSDGSVVADYSLAAHFWE